MLCLEAFKFKVFSPSFNDIVGWILNKSNEKLALRRTVWEQFRCHNKCEGITVCMSVECYNFNLTAYKHADSLLLRPWQSSAHLHPTCTIKKDRIWNADIELLSRSYCVFALTCLSDWEYRLRMSPVCDLCQKQKV